MATLLRQASNVMRHRAPLLPTSSAASTPTAVDRVADAAGGAGKAVHKTYRSWLQSQMGTKLTYVWLVGSVLLLLLGVRTCATAVDMRSLVCDNQKCTLKVRSNIGGENEDYQLELDRAQLLSSAVVRLRRGAVVDTTGMRRKHTRKLGWTYSVEYDSDKKAAQKAYDEKTTSAPAKKGKSRTVVTVPMSYASLGRKRPRRRQNEVDSYIRRRRDAVSVEESSGVSATGVLEVIFGTFLLIFCALIGQFADPEERPARLRKKKRAM